MGGRYSGIRMNGLLAAMAVANPVITALLTVVVFLEKDKIKKRSEDLEGHLKGVTKNWFKPLPLRRRTSRTLLHASKHSQKTLQSRQRPLLVSPLL